MNSLYYHRNTQLCTVLVCYAPVEYFYEPRHRLRRLITVAAGQGTAVQSWLLTSLRLNPQQVMSPNQVDSK